MQVVWKRQVGINLKLIVIYDLGRSQSFCACCGLGKYPPSVCVGGQPTVLLSGGES